MTARNRVTVGLGPALFTATVHGQPVPQGSKSVNRRTGVMFEQNKGTAPWRKTMVEAFTALHTTPWTPIDGPLIVQAHFYLARPKRPLWPVPGVKPDLDKLQRNVGDALESSNTIVGDARIIAWDPLKLYDDGDGPRLELTIYAVNITTTEEN